MACFIVPAVEAVVTTIATKVVKSKEIKSENLEVGLDSKDIESVKDHFHASLDGWATFFGVVPDSLHLSIFGMEKLFHGFRF